MYILGEQLAGHEAFFEAGGAEACEQVEIFEEGDLADKWMQVACEWHPASPGASDGEVFEEWEEFKDMGAVGLDAGLFRARSLKGSHVHLPIATENDLAVACLATIEVTSEPLVLSMGKFERCLLIAVAPRFIVGVVVPVVVRFERADAMKYPGRHRSRRPHLAAHGVDRNVETEHGPEGATPWTGG